MTKSLVRLKKQPYQILNEVTGTSFHSW